MCGITGLVAFNAPLPRTEDLRRMIATLRPRGPDGEGIYSSPNGEVLLGNSRLAIVDVVNGAQPLTVQHAGSDYAITYNGEVYNHGALRRQLEAKGHRFCTNCDTEVVVRAYVEWGLDSVRRFNGQFAFVIHDDARRRVFMARDRVGIKPLYYSPLPGGLLSIGSEPKAILAHPSSQPRPDPRSFVEFLICSNIFPNGCPPLDASYFRGISALEPGTYAVIDTDGMSVHRYYDLPSPPRLDAPDASETMRELLEAAIVDCVPSEVPFGVMLSGGLDSSIIASLLSRQGHRFPCFTIRYEAQTNPDFDSARMLAEDLGQELIAPVLTPEALFELVDPLVRALDAPLDALRHLGLFAAYREMRNAGAKVALVGEGSDEFNLGYYWMYPGFGAGGEPALDGNRFRARLRSSAALVANWFADGFTDGVDLDEIIERQVERYYDARLEGRLDRIQRYYARKFLKYRLDANDTCGMAHAVEARVPYCDDAVIAHCLSIPHRTNLEGGTEKVVLRRAFGDILPPIIASRRKYAIPNCEHLLLARKLVERLAEVTTDPRAMFWEVLDRGFIGELTRRVSADIDRLWREGGDGRGLIDDSSPEHQSGYTTKNVFIALTTARWHDLYISRGGSL